jgi:Holliday junction DNA helicase RuvA
MIGKLTGTWQGAEGGMGLIEVGGVGYAVRVPLYTLTTAPGTMLALFIHTAVREDAIDLYGFMTGEELSFFRQLVGVSGVGPKTALGVLNVSDLASLKRSIAAGDASALTKVFGIGKKSAERIVVELKDKVGYEVEAGGQGSDVIDALVALGYSTQEARKALRQVGGSDAKEQIQAALKYLGSA